MRAPGFDTLCNFIISAWNDIPEEIVINSFKKCGTSNSLDGMDDDYLWATSEADDTGDEAADDNPDDAEFDNKEVRGWWCGGVKLNV